jgi:hypothetical protein
VRLGGTQRGSREDEVRRSKHRSEGAVATERGAQQAARVVAAGALEVFTAKSSITYHRAAEALEVFTAKSSITYRRAAEALEVSSVDSQPTIYKRAAGALAGIAADPSLPAYK